MYQKILVPVDNSKDSESILKAIPELVAPGGEVTLLHVIPPGRTRSAGGFTVLGSQLEEEDRAKGMWQLNLLAVQLQEASITCKCAVEVSTSVAECISSFAQAEQADLIAMYTHNRKGLAKLIRRSVAAAVQRVSPVEVRAMGPSELREYDPVLGASAT